MHFAHVEESIEICASRVAVWAISGDPGNIAYWFPGLAKVVMVGDLRYATFASGQTALERIVRQSDEEFVCSYELVEGDFPFNNYRSDFRLEATQAGSRALWRAEFVPHNPSLAGPVSEAIASDYRAGLNSLRRIAEQGTG